MVAPAAGLSRSLRSPFASLRSVTAPPSGAMLRRGPVRGGGCERIPERTSADPHRTTRHSPPNEQESRFKEGAARCRTGQCSYAPHVAFWAERGRALTSELVGGNREKLSGGECARIASRALGLLPDGHGPVTMRIDSAYYAIELLKRLRKDKTRFTVSVPRNAAIWDALGRIDETASTDALDMPGAQVGSPRPPTGPAAGSTSRSD